MRFMMKRLAALFLTAAMLWMCFPAAPVLAHESGAPGEVNGRVVLNLLAGQSKNVGSVIAEETGDNKLLVTYALNEQAINEGWLIYETHLAVAGSENELPRNKRGNAVPGQFPYHNTFPEGVDTYSIVINNISGFHTETLHIAAHAVIKKVTSVTTVAAPYGGTRVYAYKQGLRSDGNTIDVYRSNPDQSLQYETGMSVENFYSLGFDVSRDSGWIIIEFDNPITNGTGNDLEVIEDTWISPYVNEFADVYVSNCGKGWRYLGRASNLNKINQYNSSTEFDLSDVNMCSAKYVKLQDVSSNEQLTDGFDLNAVLALHDYVRKTTEEESCWAEGTKFCRKGSWGMYFTFHINRLNACKPFNLFRFLFCWKD